MLRCVVSLLSSIISTKNTRLWEIDDSFDGLEIIDADNRDQSVLSMVRKNRKGDLLVCVFQYGTSRTQGLYDWCTCIRGL